MNKNEAFARVAIDAQLAALGWDTQDTNAVRYEVVLDDGTRADYILSDYHGRRMTVIEARYSFLRYREPQESHPSSLRA